MDRLWNRNYCKVMTANFSLFFAFYVLTPLLPLYLSEHFGATKDVIGLVLSGYTITALLFRPFSGLPPGKSSIVLRPTITAAPRVFSRKCARSACSTTGCVPRAPMPQSE